MEVPRSQGARSFRGANTLTRAAGRRSVGSMGGAERGPWEGEVGGGAWRVT